nr:hypothetical protein GCM10020241_02180 [Streptoalloteichus tenebrarius]
MSPGGTSVSSTTVASSANVLPARRGAAAVEGRGGHADDRSPCGAGVLGDFDGVGVDPAGGEDDHHVVLAHADLGQELFGQAAPPLRDGAGPRAVQGQQLRVVQRAHAGQAAGAEEGLGDGGQRVPGPGGEDDPA